MKNRFKIWHQPVLAFFSKHLYRDISLRWKGTNLGYLFVLLAICLLPAAMDVSRQAAALIDHKAAIYLMQIPRMQINAGRLAVDAPQPYSIIEGNRTVLLIDTAGKVATLEDAGADALLTATQLHIRQENKPPMVYDLSSFDGFELDQDIAAEFIGRMKRFILPAYYGVSLLFSYILLLLAALLSGALALFFGWVQKRQLDYAAGLRLSVMAFTPPLILGSLLRLAGLTVPATLYILLTLAYLYMAVGCSRKAHSQPL